MKFLTLNGSQLWIILSWRRASMWIYSLSQEHQRMLGQGKSQTCWWHWNERQIKAILPISQCFGTKTMIMERKEMFFELEDLEVTINPKCDGCKCSACPIPVQIQSLWSETAWHHSEESFLWWKNGKPNTHGSWHVILYQEMTKLPCRILMLLRSTCPRMKSLLKTFVSKYRPWLIKELLWSCWRRKLQSGRAIITA